MNKKEIGTYEFNNIIENNNIALLCGNGFSMNFDSSFGNIFDRLYESHLIWKRNCEYNVKAGDLFKNKLKGNYDSLKRYLLNFNESQIREIFDDGLVFAKFVTNDSNLVNQLREEEWVKKLEFGIDELDIAFNIAKEEDTSRINIEYWTILVQIYYAIKYCNSNYKFPESNRFITSVEQGDAVKGSFLGENPKNNIKASEQAMLNGFTTYYRFLFCISIFNNGKYMNINNMDRVSTLDLDKIRNFLEKFDSIFTTNYDTILEKILLDRSIIHLHGQFSFDAIEYCYHQSLSLKLDNGSMVSFSDILIGDYFVNKTIRPVVSTLASKKFLENKKSLNINEMLEKEINKNNVNTFFILGLNIDNDQHILKGIMSNLYFSEIENPKIVFSYYQESDKQIFEEQLEKCITFNEAMNRYCNEIDIYFINTRYGILDKYFNNRNV